MRISWGNRIDVDNLNAGNGYGYATERIIATLREQGHEVSWNDASADVHIHFDQPHHLKVPRKGMYTVLYHPWESTLLLPGWSDIMNSCNEVWTPSPLIADWYARYSGVTVPIYVYEHGVDDIWTTVERERSEKFTFLHIGGEAARKGVSDTMSAFRKVFWKKKNVELNLKMVSNGWKIGSINRINIINSRLEIEDLVKMYHDNNVFVYPSYGEGFGLTPLQAMATGMPTITVPKWAPYAEFLDPTLNVESSMVRSPWPSLHPGNMMKPSGQSLEDSMEYAYKNYEEVNSRALESVDRIKKYYDWSSLTSKVFADLGDRLRTS